MPYNRCSKNLGKSKGANDKDPSSTQTAQKYDRAAMDQSRHSRHARQRPIPGGPYPPEKWTIGKTVKVNAYKGKKEKLWRHRGREKSRMTGR